MRPWKHAWRFYREFEWDLAAVTMEWKGRNALEETDCNLVSRNTTFPIFVSRSGKNAVHINVVECCENTVTFATSLDCRAHRILLRRWSKVLCKFWSTRALRSFALPTNFSSPFKSTCVAGDNSQMAEKTPNIASKKHLRSGKKLYLGASSAFVFAPSRHRTCVVPEGYFGKLVTHHQTEGRKNPSFLPLLITLWDDAWYAPTLKMICCTPNSTFLLVSITESAVSSRTCSTFDRPRISFVRSLQSG